MRAVSKRKAREDRAYRVWRDRFLADRAVCERCGDAWSRVCHHRRRRSQGGALMSEQNCSALCLACHEWVHANTAAAAADGWLVTRDSDEWAALGSARGGRSVPDVEVADE